VSGIRIVLTVTKASPELYAALQEVPARLRAERVRTLATLGLAAVGGGIGSRPAMGPTTEAPPQNAGPTTKALSFAKSLGDGV
jgi:hypothetical protein